MSEQYQEHVDDVAVEDVMSETQLVLLELGHRLRGNHYTFITPTPLTHQRVNEREGNVQGRTLREVFGWNRPFISGLLPLDEERDLVSNGVVTVQGGRLISRVRWSSLDDLLLVHSAFPTSQEDSVFFGPDTYRFVQSIRRLLRLTTKTITRAVDIGCGTGVGAMVIAQENPQAEVLAVDINPRALSFTQVNARLAGLDNLISCKSNVLDDVDGKFDLIVANPPYMKDPKKRAYRHGGDALGSNLSVRIVRESLERLSVGGSLVLYTGVAIVDGEDPFIASLERDLDTASMDWTYRELDPDVFGEELLELGYEQVDRIAAVELVVTRRA
ncbi:MAG: modification methylase, HemK family [Mucilaginibacter sp.]|nr:modification methylase, HemK family [Mucilaginibacter sp.]